LDHPIRQAQDGPRDREPEGPGGLEVDHQLELHGLLHGQVGRLGAFEDLVHVDGALPDSFMASPASHAIWRGDEELAHVAGEQPRGLHGGSTNAGDRVRLTGC